MIRTSLTYHKSGLFGTFAKNLKVKKTKTQAQKTKNSRVVCPKLKIPAKISKN